MDLSPARVIRGLKNLYRREVLRDGSLLEARRFFRENGEARRLDYPLGPESVVVDLGGIAATLPGPSTAVMGQ